MALQEIALCLQDFWKEEGCPTISPCGPIPAGVLTPDVFFGVLAPRPWCASQMVSVVDPSLAPYGDDPLSPIIDRHLQVTRCDPSSDLRARFIESLRMLGLDLPSRDIRFVAHNYGWKQSYLAVRAAGWRVLIDQIEVGSLSYLQRLGEIDFEPVPMMVEYSLGRLAISVGIEDEDVPTERGRQIAAYALECADPERINSLLSLHADECEQALAGGFYFPAYEHVLASVYLHSLFALHDSSSDEGQSGRAAHIADLASGCARMYVEALDA
jgi:glycyl-tRNA synthetase alpha subunit